MMIFLAALLLALQVGDLYLTHKALALGAREANPISRWIIEKTGSVWLGGLSVKAPVFVLVVLAESPPLTVFAIALMCWVCWNNWSVVKQLESRK